MVKAILFDMDGTLVDSISCHNKALETVLERLGVKVSKKKLKSLLRLPTEEIYFQLNVKKKTGINFQAFNHFKRGLYYDSIRGKKIVFPGVEKMLKRLKKKYKLAIVSNSSKKTVVMSMPKNLLSLFDAVITHDDVKRGKPDPESLKKALHRLKVNSMDAVFVGDSHFDVIASNELSINCFGISTGVSSKKELRDNGAWMILERVRDVEKFL